MPNASPTILEDLIARVAKGDRRAFDTLYDTTSAGLNALCLSVLRDRGAAEDVLEQVYVGIWKQAGRFPDSGLSPMAWLATMARDKAMERATPAVPPAGGPALDGIDMVRAAYLHGIGMAGLAQSQGLPAEAVRLELHDGLARINPLADGGPDDMLAAEMALGLADRRATDPALADRMRDWQEHLSRFAGDLTPVMAPARARQRIRESLGHGKAPLSVDPLEPASRWRGTGGVLAVVLLIGGAAWYFLTR